MTKSGGHATCCGLWRSPARLPSSSTTAPILPPPQAATGCTSASRTRPTSRPGDIVGDQAIVGVTCHASRHLAITAAEAGADYVAFGAFYATTTKEPKFRADPDIVSWWSELMTVPCVAIGGITVENCRPLIEAGADFLAVCGGVWQHPSGPVAAVAQFQQLLGPRSPDRAAFA